MKVSSYQDTQPVQELPGVLKREVINVSDGAPNFCMRVFDVDPGSNTPSHEHNWNTRCSSWPVREKWSGKREKQL